MAQITTNTNLNWLVAPLSGVIEVSCTHWLDRIKTKMQEHSLTKQNPSFTYAIKTIHQEGLTKFYTGYVPRLCGIVPMRFVYWGTMRTMNDKLKNQSNTIKLFITPIVVGTAQTIVDNPIEVLKVRQMTGETCTAINNITKAFTATLYRNILFALPVTYFVRTYGHEHPFLAGAIGGAIGSIISQPFDVVKTELQRYHTNTKHKTMIDIMETIIQHDPKGMMSGVTMRSVLGFANMGIGFFAFSHIYHFLELMIY
jgi:hypothetical protein